MKEDTVTAKELTKARQVSEKDEGWKGFVLFFRAKKKQLHNTFLKNIDDIFWVKTKCHLAGTCTILYILYLSTWIKIYIYTHIYIYLDLNDIHFIATPLSKTQQMAVHPTHLNLLRQSRHSQARRGGAIGGASVEVGYFNSVFASFMQFQVAQEFRLLTLSKSSW